MSHVRIVEPAAEPISVADAMDYLRVVNAADASLVTDMIAAARDMIEMFTGRAMISQQWRMQLPFWIPRDPLYYFGPQVALAYAWDWKNVNQTPVNYIELPRSPVISVQSVKYYDTANVLQMWDPANYLVDTVSVPGKIELADGINWPDTAKRSDAIQINFTAGYGTASTSVPPSLRQAVKFAVKHYYDNRDSVVVERATVDELPMTLRNLIEMHRVDFTS